jgi:hypothetical protein
MHAHYFLTNLLDTFKKLHGIGANEVEISVSSIIKALPNMVGGDFHKHKKSVAYYFPNVKY